MLKRIFGLKRKTGEDCIMRSFMTCTLHQILRVIKRRRIRWVGHVARMEQTRNEHNMLVGKSEEKRELGRPRRRWEGVDWTDMTQDR
jgi:hypothetical protein